MELQSLSYAIKAAGSAWAPFVLQQCQTGLPLQGQTCLVVQGHNLMIDSLLYKQSVQLFHPFHSLLTPVYKRYGLRLGEDNRLALGNDDRVLILGNPTVVSYAKRPTV